MPVKKIKGAARQCCTDRDGVVQCEQTLNDEGGKTRIWSSTNKVFQTKTQSEAGMKKISFVRKGERKKKLLKFLFPFFSSRILLLIFHVAQFTDFYDFRAHFHQASELMLRQF